MSLVVSMTHATLQLTVHGSGFHKSDAIACAFGDVTVTAMFLSENSVRCRYLPPQIERVLY